MPKDGLPRCPSQPCPGLLAVVAIGNPSRQDDGLANVLLEGMKEQPLPGACLIDLGTYTSYLSGVLEQHRRMVIIDTAQMGLEPGDFRIVPLDDSAPGLATSIRSSHGFSFFDELLIAARELTTMPLLSLFLVEPRSVEWAEGLSKELQEAVPQLLKELRIHLENEAPVYA